MTDGRDPRRFLRRTLLVAFVGALALIGTLLAVVFLARDDPDARPIGAAVDDWRSTTSEVPPSAPEPLRPPSGVYQLEGEGRESLSFPPVEQRDGDVMPMTVSHRPDGCWELRIDYNEAHWQDWSFCPDGDTLTETGGHTWQVWDLGVTSVENLTTFTCEPAAPFVARGLTIGHALEHECRGTSDRIDGDAVSAGSTTFVGVEDVVVGGEPVEALHFRRENSITGAQSGRERLDLWLAAFDFLPLRGEREVVVDSDSPIGTITYHESGEWFLTSREPFR